MKVEKKERKQFGSVAASLFVALIIVSSVVFLNVKYTFGEYMSFFMFNSEFVGDHPNYSNSELKLYKPDAVVLGGVEDVEDVKEIRSWVRIHAYQGILLGEGTLITEENLNGNNSNGLEESDGATLDDDMSNGSSLESLSEDAYAASYTQEQMQNTATGGGSTAFSAFSYVPTFPGKETKGRVVSLTSVKKGESVSFVVDGSVKADDFVVNSDGRPLTLKRALDIVLQLSRENKGLSEKQRLLEEKVERLEDKLNLR